MRLVGISLALCGLLAVPAMAADWGSISGHVTDLHTGQPMANARLTLYRTSQNPNGPYQLMHVTTNGRGYFVKMPLEPGRYVLLADVPGRTRGCVIEDLIGRENVRVNIRVGYDTLTCSGPRVHTAMANRNIGGDLYIR